MSTKQENNNEEEVDLGSLFVIIGKGFSRVFNFITSIFKGVFHFFISILIFLKDNFIKIGIAAVIGFIAGFILEKNKDKSYSSDLLVQPNYKSAQQLYNNVNFYNDLVKQKDTARIQMTFKLDKETASSLQEFTIEPVINDNDVINSYNSFITSVDTTTVKSYTFEEFKASYTDLDYRIHKINVIATKNDVFNKLDEVILGSVMKNEYFNSIKESTTENLNRTDSLLRRNLGQIDSLRKIYMEVMVEEAKKQTSGTSIDLGGEKKTTKELELFETNSALNSELKDVVSEKSYRSNIINVVSNFQPIGSEVKGLKKHMAVQLSVLGMLLMILTLLFIKVNKYLSNYKKD